MEKKNQPELRNFSNFNPNGNWESFFFFKVLFNNRVKVREHLLNFFRFRTFLCQSKLPHRLPNSGRNYNLL